MEDKVSNAELSDREVFYIEQYKNDKRFTVMNKQKGGGRGSIKRISIKPKSPDTINTMD